MSRHFIRSFLLCLVPILLSCGSGEDGPSDPAASGNLCKQDSKKIECSTKDLKIDASCILLAGTEGRDVAVGDAVLKDDLVTFSAPEAGKYDFRYTCDGKSTMMHKDFVVKPLTPLKSASPNSTNPSGPGGGGSGGGSGGGGGGGGGGGAGLCYKNEDCFAPRLCNKTDGTCYLPDGRCEEKKDCKKDGQVCNKDSYTCKFEPGRCDVATDCPKKDGKEQECDAKKWCKLPDPKCGNNVPETGEECDDGKDGSAKCTKDCKAILPTLKTSINAKLVAFGVYEITYEIKEKYQQAQIFGPFNRTEFAEGCGDEVKGDFIVNNSSGGSTISKDSENYEKYKPYLVGEKCDEGKKNCFGYEATMVNTIPNPIPAPTASLVSPRSLGERLRTALSLDNLFLRNAYSYSAASYSAHSSAAHVVGSYFDKSAATSDFSVVAIDALGGTGEFKEATTCKIDLKDKSASGTFYVRLNQRNAKFRIAATDDDGKTWKSHEAKLTYDVAIKNVQVSIDKKEPRIEVLADYEHANGIGLETWYKNKGGEKFTKKGCDPVTGFNKDGDKATLTKAGSGAVKWSCPLNLYQRLIITANGIGVDNYRKQTVVAELEYPKLGLKKGELKCGATVSGESSDDGDEVEEEDLDKDEDDPVDDTDPLDDKDPKDKAGVDTKHCRGVLIFNWGVRRKVRIWDLITKKDLANEELKKKGIRWVKSVKLWRFDNSAGAWESGPLKTVNTDEGIAKGNGKWDVQREHQHTDWKMEVEDFDGAKYEKIRKARFKPGFKMTGAKQTGCDAKTYKKSGSHYGTCVEASGQHAGGQITWTGRHIKKVRIECSFQYVDHYAYYPSDGELKAVWEWSPKPPREVYQKELPPSYTITGPEKPVDLKIDFAPIFDGGGGAAFCNSYYTGYDGIELHGKEEGFDWQCGCNGEGWLVPLK